MKFILSLAVGLSCGALVCCTNSTPVKHTSTTANHTKNSEWLKETNARLQKLEQDLTPPDPSPEQIAEAKILADIYYKGLIRSIRRLDDKKSPADIIARAAVHENRPALIDWKRKQTEHLKDILGINFFEKKLATLPWQTHIDEATMAVLRVRRLNRL